MGNSPTCTLTIKGEKCAAFAFVTLSLSLSPVSYSLRLLSIAVTQFAFASHSNWRAELSANLSCASTLTLPLSLSFSLSFGGTKSAHFVSVVSAFSNKTNADKQPVECVKGVRERARGMIEGLPHAPLVIAVMHMLF